MGTIHLFADTTSLDISADITQFGTKRIWIAYSDLDNTGLPCIFALEFMVQWDEPYLVATVPTVFREEYVSFTMGSIRTGISIVLRVEVYLYDDYVFLGYFTVIGLQDIVAGSDPVILSVVGDPASRYNNPIIAACDLVRSLHEVQGGKFVFPFEARVIGTESRSWGAIKALLE